jgi:hypothetical protein
MKIIAQSQAVPKPTYVHLAYTSAGNDVVAIWVVGCIAVLVAIIAWWKRTFL